MSNKSKLPTINNLLKVLIPLAIGVGLFWYLYGPEFPGMMERLAGIHYLWILLSMALGIVGHWLRAYRWKLLLIPTGHNPPTGHTLLGLFIGYFANLVLPRIGEVARCLSLKKSDGVPIPIAIGTVISERILDLIFLAIIALGTFLIEFDRLQDFFKEIIANKLDGINRPYLIVIVLVLTFSILLMFLVWYRFKDRILSSAWGLKLINTLSDVRQGITSLFRVKHQWQFWLSSILIWITYYFMSYLVFFAMESTLHLGWEAALSLLVAGGLGMSAPVQGGIGAYHYLVSTILIIYGISRSEGLLFAFILHTSQTLLIVVLGLISLIIVLYLTRSEPAQGTGHSPLKDKNI